MVQTETRPTTFFYPTEFKFKWLHSPSETWAAPCPWRRWRPCGCCWCPWRRWNADRVSSTPLSSHRGWWSAARTTCKYSSWHLQGLASYLITRRQKVKLSVFNWLPHQQKIDSLLNCSFFIAIPSAAWGTKKMYQPWWHHWLHRSPVLLQVCMCQRGPNVASSWRVLQRCVHYLCVRK